MNPLPPLIASRYRPLRELGRGGMGVVYLVEHVHTGDRLALKLLIGAAAQDRHAIARFQREARASARIKSEHVVKIVDAAVAPELGGAPFLVMELLNGTDLQKHLAAHGPLSVADALRYLAQAASALDRSHSVGIVHRDLKPENLFLHTREDGVTVLKVLDFGISKILGGEPGGDIGSAAMTTTGAVMGTPLYMSPEQARGRISEIGPASDVWAMGIIALRMLTGQVYWRAESVGELMAQVIAEPLYAPTERWPWLPPAIDGWFATACAREPKRRFSSVGEEVDALALALRGEASAGATARLAATALEGGPIAANGPGEATTGGRTTMGAAGERSPTFRPRRRSGGLFAGAGLVLAVAGGGFYLARGSLATKGTAADAGHLIATASVEASTARDDSREEDAGAPVSPATEPARTTDLPSATPEAGVEQDSGSSGESTHHGSGRPHPHALQGAPRPFNPTSM